MNTDRDKVRTGEDSSVPDERPDEELLEEETETTGQFTIDYTPPAWYSGGAAASVPPPPPMGAASVPPPAAPPAPPQDAVPPPSADRGPVPELHPQDVSVPPSVAPQQPPAPREEGEGLGSTTLQFSAAAVRKAVREQRPPQLPTPATWPPSVSTLPRTPPRACQPRRQPTIEI
ncbi:SCO5717 family growth-regulating ATPase, partial [Streptomyces sp. NPDC059853]|uniref:SCO5717 family growth-regulating ATPase n=1 Tax=Streptomyces sp. NPDC059853 TaxID=3346973 RepID=UPI00365FE057